MQKQPITQVLQAGEQNPRYHLMPPTFAAHCLNYPTTALDDNDKPRLQLCLLGNTVAPPCAAWVIGKVLRLMSPVFGKEFPSPYVAVTHLAQQFGVMKISVDAANPTLWGLSVAQWDAMLQNTSPEQRRAMCQSFCLRNIIHGSYTNEDILTIFRLWSYYPNLNMHGVVHSLPWSDSFETTVTGETSSITVLYPDVFTFFCNAFYARCDPEWRQLGFNAVTINGGYRKELHIDPNYGPSAMIILGNLEGGELQVFPNTTLQALANNPNHEIPLSVNIPPNIWTMFNGRWPHQVLPYVGERHSAILYTVGYQPPYPHVVWPIAVEGSHQHPIQSYMVHDLQSRTHQMRSDIQGGLALHNFLLRNLNYTDHRIYFLLNNKDIRSFVILPTSTTFLSLRAQDG